MSLFMLAFAQMNILLFILNLIIESEIRLIFKDLRFLLILLNHIGLTFRNTY